MSLQQWLALAAMASLPFAAAAEQKQSESNPADPSAPASAFRYESAFKSYRTPSDEGQAPDKIWRSTNDEMEKLGGHAGHIKADGDAAPSTKAEITQPIASPSDHSKHH
jgi:hypothetical protein